jgi:dihydroflavonol-4-reductase
VTGAAGFLGFRLVQSYLDRGHSVRAFVRTWADAWRGREGMPDGLDVVEMDLCDIGRNPGVFTEQDLVIHAAAMLHATTPAERALQERVNVDVTRTIAEMCRHNGVRRLVHVSTTAAIGVSEDPALPATEDFRFNLDRVALHYHHTKHRAEQSVLEADGPDLEAVIVNPGFIFGPHPGGYRGAEVIERVLGKRVVLCTHGGLSIVHIDDVVDGVRRVAERARHGRRYILAGENLSFREMAHTVARVSGRRRVVLTVPNLGRDLAGLFLNSGFARRRGSGPRLHLDRRYAYQYYSSERARVELGYRPRSFASIVDDVLSRLRDRASPPPRSADVG